jgi:hypothetical protein
MIRFTHHFNPLDRNKKGPEIGAFFYQYDSILFRRIFVELNDNGTSDIDG